jgi:hypothetical protein
MVIIGALQDCYIRPVRIPLPAAVFLFSLSVWADEPEPRWMTLNHVAGEAVKAKDYAKLRATLDELWPLMPGNPRVLYNMAASDAVLGNQQKALEELHCLAAAGLIYDLAAEEDFTSLRQSFEYAGLVKQMEQNRKPVAAASEARVFEERDLLPEDIAYDARKREFLVSSVAGSKIIHAETGQTLAKSEWSVMALRIDPKRRILWAAIAWLPHCQSCRAEDKDKTAMLSFHLDTGALIKRYDSPVPGMFGDMTISRKGDIYVSEGIHGAVFQLADGKFQRLDTPGEFPSPQTPALSQDERTLYVSDYVRGIGAMDLKTHAVKWLEPAPGIILSGIDGLYVYRDSFVAVQNGTNPARIVRWSLDLKRQQILETNTPGLGEPTHGTFVGDAFYFLANTGWSEYDENGKKKPGSAPVVSSIRKIDLHGPL